MKTALELLPPQVSGRQTDFTHEKKLGTLATALQALHAATRLLSVNNWHFYSGLGSARFALCNNHAEPVEVMAELGLFFSIDRPAPGSDTGDGLKWIMIDFKENSHG